MPGKKAPAAVKSASKPTKKAQQSPMKAAKNQAQTKASPSTKPSTSKTVERKDVSRFLSGLGYKATTKAEDATHAQQLLQDAWCGFFEGSFAEAFGKKNLVATYMEKGGIKNLEWVPSYFESSETLNTDLVEAEKGYYTAAKVLSFQGFVVGQNLAPDRSSAVLQALLEENWQANGLDKNDPELAQENSACPELKKYFYIHSVQKDIAASTHKTSLHQSADLKHQGLKAVLDKKGSDGPAVKLENPGFTELKARQTDLLAELELKNGKNTYDDVLKEGSKHCDSADDFLKKCRDANGKINGMSLETPPKEVEEQLDSTNGNIQMAIVHCEGLKAFKNRLKVGRANGEYTRSIHFPRRQPEGTCKGIHFP
ncbi:unnamed protein product [Symbiodinium natans]|uniref:Uncharacterized protein n=1 Tax=Symbiodinium natans TaxID=878477 RepID=A0A812S7L8_9DINO|nr:unnamed protein product [Symbiodinium natans]